MSAHLRPNEFKTAIAGRKAVSLRSRGRYAWRFHLGRARPSFGGRPIEFDGITATSAGAINAALLAYGLSVGGREAAREVLALFWRRVSAIMACSILQPSILDKVSGNFGLDYSPGYLFLSILCQFLSPYQLNPLNINPLKCLLEELIDFRCIRRQTAIKLFLCATNIRTGKLKMFHGRALTSNHVVVRSCLPFLMHAVEIDGERYWDGGFIGNPAFFPLIYECIARDIILVHVTPGRRASTFPSLQTPS